MTRFPSLHFPMVSDQIIKWMRDVGQREQFQKVVIGVSGGVDSATTLALSVKAYGEKNVFPFILPFGELGKQAEFLGRKVCMTFGIAESRITRVDITPYVTPFFSSDLKMDTIRRGNIMARARMILLYDAAKKQNALVMGTENKSEHVLGYFTRFGDEASDMEPIIDLYKTHIIQLASFLHVPKEILESIPSAGLWEGQTDEKEFGFTYEEADQILYLAHDEKKSKDEIVSMGFSKNTVENILARVEKNTFKSKTPYLFFNQ